MLRWFRDRRQSQSPPWVEGIVGGEGGEVNWGGGKFGEKGGFLVKFLVFWGFLGFLGVSWGGWREAGGGGES